MDEQSRKVFMKYGNLTLGQIEAGINKIGGEEAFMRLLRGELTLSAPILPSTADSEIRLSVTSDGTTGEQWIKRLKKKGFSVSPCAKRLIRLPDFNPTKGVTYEVAIIKDSFWKSDNERTRANIRAEADKRKFVTPNAEVACLLREKLTDKEVEAMGLWWVAVVREPIKDSGDGPGLLALLRGGERQWLQAYYDKPGSDAWYGARGFAFVVPQQG